METVLNLTPGQLFLGLMLQIWTLIIFPVIVIRKLNYLTALVESFYEEDTTEGKSGESQP